MQLRDGGIDEFGHVRFTGVAQQLAIEIEKRIRKEVRTTVLGHVQRGGTPTPYFVSICTPIPMLLDSELPR